MIPFVSGIIGGVIDAKYTMTIGNQAKKLFVENTSDVSENNESNCYSDNYIDITSENLD